MLASWRHVAWDCLAAPRPDIDFQSMDDIQMRLGWMQGQDSSIDASVVKWLSCAGQHVLEQRYD